MATIQMPSFWVKLTPEQQQELAWKLDGFWESLPPAQRQALARKIASIPVPAVSPPPPTPVRAAPQFDPDGPGPIDQAASKLARATGGTVVQLDQQGEREVLVWLSGAVDDGSPVPF